jgi:hypothetical protein
MTKSRNQLPLVFSRAVLSIAFLGSLSFFTEAKAKCSTDACLTGYGNCLGWCSTHNKTAKSDGACSVKCGDYWHDGASLRQPNPPNPSQGTVGPGRVNPPTSVSDPTPPSHQPVVPVKPVSVSNPNKTSSSNSGPVILLRKNDSGGGQEYGHH